MLAGEICMQISRFFHKNTKILKCMQISRLNCFCKQKNVNGECITGELHAQENCTCLNILPGSEDPNQNWSKNTDLDPGPC